MSDDARPCLIFEGPPKMIWWPKVTFDLDGRPFTVDALCRIGEKDPQWVVAEIGGGGATTMKSMLLDMPVIPITDQDVRSPNCMKRVLKKIRHALPRKAA